MHSDWIDRIGNLHIRSTDLLRRERDDLVRDLATALKGSSLEAYLKNNIYQRDCIIVERTRQADFDFGG